MNFRPRFKIITLTRPSTILSDSYYKRLWLAVRNLNIPRRNWLDELADTFRDFDGQILTANNRIYELPLIDELFGDDFEMRWMGYYMRADITGNYPRSKSRKIERLQILDLYFRIKYPNIAQHFSR